MSRMLYLRWILMACLLATSTAQSGGWPESIQTQTDKISGIVKESWSYPAYMRNQHTRLADAFDTEMLALSRLATDEVLAQAKTREAEDVTAKLLILAQYRQQNEERIKQITARFSQPAQSAFPTRAAPKPPKISGEWLAATDRLAWEYLVLRPKGDDAFFLRRVSEGIASIGDPASVLTLVTAFQFTQTTAALPGKHKQIYQSQLIDTLVHMPSNLSLRALLTIEKQLASSPEFKPSQDQTTQWRTSDRELKGYASKALQTSITETERGKWKTLFQAFPRQLPPTELQHLHDLQRNLESKR